MDIEDNNLLKLIKTYNKSSISDKPHEYIEEDSSNSSKKYTFKIQYYNHITHWFHENIISEKEYIFMCIINGYNIIDITQLNERNRILTKVYLHNIKYYEKKFSSSIVSHIYMNNGEVTQGKESLFTYFT
jgi:hypothetical protein